MANSAYSSFLSSPNTSLLADDASLNYITTTTQLSGPANILKHLQAQQRQVEKKEEKILNAIESQDGLCLETETTLLFKMGGGAYLPGVDENLLDERTVTFPMIHVVRFDSSHKIQQIRLYWDQGTLLKQVEAIGKSGRNWPIRDGSAQIAAVTKSLHATGSSQTNGSQSLPLRGPNDVVISQHTKRESISATRDPHASLSLFAPRDPNEDAESRTYDGPAIAPPKSAKPPPREYSELFAGEEDPPKGSQVRSPSPSKAEGLVLKSGAGKYHIGNRLFDENGQPELPKSPERKKTYGQKYEHFAFGDGEDAPQQQHRPVSGKAGNKAQEHFSFEDFATPPKVQEKHKPDFERHWGAGVDQDDPPSPAKRPIVHAARPDADTHFQLTDSSPAPNTTTTAKPKSLQRQKGMGLYADPIHADERAQPYPNQGVNASRRGEEFGDPHYSMTDASPADIGAAVGIGEKKIYKTAGDGMGGRKGSARVWGFGEESDPEEERGPVRGSGRGRRAQVEAGAGAEFQV